MADFVRLGTTTLYLPEGVTQADARTGYLLTKPASLERISLRDALDIPTGWFVFFRSLPATDVGLAAFLTAATTYLTAPGREKVRFGWFIDTATRPLTGFTMSLTGAAGSWVTLDRVDFVISNYILRVARGNGVSIDTASTGLVFTAPQGSVNAFLASPLGIGDQATFPATGVLGLPLVVALGGGCFHFATTADHAGLEALDAGQRYFVTSYNTPGYVDTLRYPVLDLSASSLRAAGDAEHVTLACSLDPIDPTDVGRSFFAVNADGALRTYYRNALGEVVRASPRADAAFVFRTVLSAEPTGDGGGGEGALYLTPAGSYVLTAPVSKAGADDVGAYAATLMAGLAGAEYAALTSVAANVLRFDPDGPAYAPATYATGADGTARVSFSGLDAATTTSYATIYAEPTGAVALDSQSLALTYFAQPDASVLHEPGSRTDGLLSYLALPGGSLPPPALSNARAAGGSGSFPLAPYAGTALPATSPFRDLESKLLSPTRRTIIAANGAPPALARASDDTNSPRSTTPQGLLLEREGDAWSRLTLATSVLPGGSDEDLAVTHVRGPLREALQSNQLFLVVSDGDAFLKTCDVGYRINAVVRDELTVQAQVPKTVTDRLAPLDGTSYSDQASFETAVFTVLTPYTLTATALVQLALVPGFPESARTALTPLVGKTWATYALVSLDVATALGTDAAGWTLTTVGYTADGWAMSADKPVSWGASMLQYAARFAITASGYTFDLSPYAWSTFRTVLIFKFASGRMRDLIGDTTSWSQAAFFNTSVPATQQQLADIVADADPNDPSMTYFVNTVLDDPSWNGVLALGARVPLDGLPEQLEGLAAGIDPAQFTAHHVGVSVTPVVPDATLGLVTKPSSIFGLIDYRGPGVADLTPDYQFEVLRLTVSLANSAVSAFSSNVQLLVNAMFGELAQLQGAKSSIIPFTGTYVQNDSGGSYLFTNNVVNVFGMPTSAVLDRVVVARAQFVTLTPPDGGGTTQVQTKFLMSGAIVFKSIAGFDVFSFGSDGVAGLSYANLSIDMAFDVASPSYKTFTFDVSAIAFDVAASTARPGSLYRHFPLALAGLTSGDASTRPDKANYMPVQTPMAGSSGLTNSWYALSFTLNLGTPGALAAQIGFTAGFVAAWSPTNGVLSVFVGLSIPGVTNGQRSISLQGVLTLGFGDVNFIVAGDAYILELLNITLSILSLTFPPSGQTSILLFGDPTGADRETLGWYAAFNKPSGTTPTAPSRALGGLPPDMLQWADHARRDVVAFADLPMRPE